MPGFGLDGADPNFGRSLAAILQANRDGQVAWHPSHIRRQEARRHEPVRPMAVAHNEARDEQGLHTVSRSLNYQRDVSVERPKAHTASRARCKCLHFKVR
jgi:hypothetical protein